MNLADATVLSNIPDPDRKYIVDALSLLLNHMWQGTSPYVIQSTLVHLLELAEKMDEMHDVDEANSICLCVTQC